MHGPLPRPAHRLTCLHVDYMEVTLGDSVDHYIDYKVICIEMSSIFYLMFKCLYDDNDVVQPESIIEGFIIHNTN